MQLPKDHHKPCSCYNQIYLYILKTVLFYAKKLHVSKKDSVKTVLVEIIWFYFIGFGHVWQIHFPYKNKKVWNCLSIEFHKYQKYAEQIHSSRWSDTDDYLTILRHLPIKLEIPISSTTLVKKYHVLYSVDIKNMLAKAYVEWKSSSVNCFRKTIYKLKQKKTYLDKLIN